MTLSVSDISGMHSHDYESGGDGGSTGSGDNGGGGGEPINSENTSGKQGVETDPCFYLTHIILLKRHYRAQFIKIVNLAL